MKIVTSAAALAAAVILVAGCSQGSSSTGADGKLTPSLAYVTYTYGDYQQAQVEGMESVVEPLGGSITMFNANFDAQMQQQQCQDALTSRRYAALVLAAVPGTGLACATAAKAAGIPVIATETIVGESLDDFTPQVPGVDGVVVITRKGNSDAVVEMVKKACEGLNPCKIIGEVSSPSDYVSNEPLKAVAREVPNAQVLQTFAGEYNPGKIAEKLPAVLTAHPDTQVLVTSDDGQALAAAQVIARTGLTNQIKILGSAGSRPGAAGVADGTLFATTANYPTTTGEVIAKMAIQRINGEKIDPNGVDALTLGDIRVVTEANVGKYNPEWGPAPAGG